MKKIMIGFVMVALLVSVFAFTSDAYAQTAEPQALYGQGGGRGRGGSNGGGGVQGTQSGILHDYLIAAFAEKLGLTVDEVNTRLANGETLSEIAYTEGYTLEEFQALIIEVRTIAINAAVAAGDLTQDQADWMLSHGFGTGPGQGQRQNMNPDCPYYTTNNQ